MEKIVSKEDKLTALNIESYDGPDEYIDILYENMIDNKKVQTDEPKKVYVNIDKTTDKYKILLKYVNGLLKNMGKEQIDDLTEFKNIDRLDIIKEKNRQLFNKMAPFLFKHYDKMNCGYYRNKGSPNEPLNCLRGMVKELGLFFKRTHYTKSIKGRNKSLCHYSILNYKIN